MSTPRENNIQTVWQIWLIHSINNSEESVRPWEQARSIIKHFKTFDNVSECEEFIQSVSNTARIVLFVDDLFGQEIIPRIHDLPQMFAIYIYNIENQSNESCFKRFSKVIVHQQVN